MNENNKYTFYLNDCKKESDTSQDSFTVITLIIENYISKNKDNTLSNFYGLSDGIYIINNEDYSHIINKLKNIIDIQNKNAYLSAWALSKTNDVNVYNYLIDVLEKRFMKDLLLTKQILLGISSEYFKNKTALLNKIISGIDDAEIIEIINDIKKVLKRL